MKMALSARDLHFAYGANPVLRGIDLDLRHGELVAIVGPNGAGKSTLLKLLMGFLSPPRGRVEIEGRDLHALSRRDIARIAAFVPQGQSIEFAFTVREVVAMGRSPWLGRFQPEGDPDRRAIDEALSFTELDALADRPLPELSGGERQRVFLARALAQGADVLLLDEPNANLDLRHAHALLTLLRKRVDAGGAALAALHDLTLAARYCDRVFVLSEGQVAGNGAPFEALTEEVLRRVFGVSATISRSPSGAWMADVGLLP